jgi:hypothetical protein
MDDNVRLASTCRGFTHLAVGVADVVKINADDTVPVKTTKCHHLGTHSRRLSMNNFDNLFDQIRPCQNR